MVITKESPLSILRHLRVVSSEFLKKRFDGCLFQVSFYLYNLYIYIYIHTHTHINKKPVYVCVCAAQQKTKNAKFF